MEREEASVAADAEGRAQLVSLRHLQRRLLIGGGSLVAVLILLTVLVSLSADVSSFHSAQRQHFLKAQSAVDDYLRLRDRAFAQLINVNEVIWQDQQSELMSAGTALAASLRDGDGSVVVQAPGPGAVPWLVLSRDIESVPVPRLRAYMGLLLQFSMLTTANTAPLQTSSRMSMLAHDRQGRLLAVAGYTSVAQLEAALRVQGHAAIFDRLLQVASQARRLPARASPLREAAAGGRVWTTFAENPINGDESLVSELTFAEGTTPFLRRVQFEPLDQIRSGLDATVQGTYLLVDPLTAQVLARSGGGDVVLHPGELQAATTGRVYRHGHFLIAGEIRGVDWYLVHPYSWKDLWAFNGPVLVFKLLAALFIVAVLALVLRRLQRRVVAPAMADASRVYESDALSRIIIETAPVGLVLLDPVHGEALLENEAAAAISREGQGEDTGALYPQLVARVRGQTGTALQEFQWTCDGGSDQPLRLQVSMALASWRERAVWVCALRDVTAQIEQEESLRSARRDAEQARASAEMASRAKTAFVATMSHEIRTPLNGVLGHLELLARSPLQADQAERLQRIRLSADSLMAIISDVLDFSKIEAGQLDIEPGEFALRPLIEEAALLYAPEAQRHGVKLYYAIDPDLPTHCIADVHRIRQIINNLLGNAVKFTESGRIVVRASRVEAPEGAPFELRLQVVDSGIGLSAEQLAQLFQPFQQGDASISRRYGGSGLGLALCQQLARLLGGTIRADSTLGVGSVFTLEVPAQALPDARPAPLPLEGVPVTLLSAAAEWRLELAHLLQRWGAEVQVIDSPLASHVADAAGIVMIAGERRAWAEDDEADLVRAHGRLVRAYPTAPLFPEQRDDGAHVSVFSSEAMLRALLGASGPVDSGAPQSTGPRLPRGQGRRLLLAEDNPVNRELIQQQLDALGYSVDTAENGHEALAAWQPGRHLAVLTDISMPVMNGYELARALRAQGVTVPILAVTATALAIEREHCRQAGITDLLLKPLDLSRLALALERHLGPVPAAEPRDEAETTVTDVSPSPDLAAGRHLPDKVRRAFVDTASDDLALLRQASQQGQRQVLLDRIHAFKGVLMMIGERALGARCSALELQLRDEESALPTGAIDALVDDLARRVADYADALDADPPAS